MVAFFPLFLDQMKNSKSLKEKTGVFKVMETTDTVGMENVLWNMPSLFLTELHVLTSNALKTDTL